MSSRPVLVFGYGNPSRGDDCLGPELLYQLSLRAKFNLDRVEFLIDFQLQIEHILDLQQRRLVLFVDASVVCQKPFELHQVQPERDFSYSTHAMTPAALLYVYLVQMKAPPPPAFLLSIQAVQFELGEPASAEALQNLSEATAFTEQLLIEPSFSKWSALSQNARNFAA